MAIKGCRGITAISIPEDNAIRSIGESAFSDCTSIVGFSIPSLLTTIEPYTFKGCSSLARISIPQRITQIGEYAFEGCSGLLDVIFANDASLTKLSAWAFFGCERLAIIDLPESLTEIGASVFRKCNTLESVTIPAATTTIGSYAFSYCKNLSTLQVEQGNPMFYAVDNCIVNRATRSVVVGCKTSKIPADDSVVSVGAYAFAGCSGLKSLKIPEGIVSIGGYAFVDCTNLKTVDLPVSVTLVEGGAFSGCDRTTHIYYHGDVSEVWQTIDIKNGNDGLTRNDGTAAGTVNWYTYSATRPTTVGMFWRYTSSGTPKVWT